MQPNNMYSEHDELQENCNFIQTESLDCGIKSLGWCTRGSCQKFATIRYFVIILTICGILQGAAETYFRISVNNAALLYGYNVTVVDWLLVTNGIAQSLLAVVIAYWAQRFHPMNWIGSLVIFQSLTAVLVIIPTLTHFSEQGSGAISHVHSDVCASTVVTHLDQFGDAPPFRITTLVLLFVLQMSIGLASAAFYTIGVSYLDDNTNSKNSPAVIGIAVASKILGPLFGSALSLLVKATPLGWWLGWAIIAPFIFTTGVTLCLFPRKLVRTVVQQAATHIIRRTSNRNVRERVHSYIEDFTLYASIKRLLKTKILILNLLGLTFINTAIVNYASQEQTYLQSRFYFTSYENNGHLDNWNLKFLPYILSPPIVGISVFVGGLVISKLKPSARKITIWNMSIGIIITTIFVAFIFIRCDVGKIAGVASGRISQPFCSHQCICTMQQFSPVCPENGTDTYFSPCHAGCSHLSSINNINIYEGCTCGLNPESVSDIHMRATEGACNAKHCQQMALAFQTLSIIGAALLGKCIVGKIIIILRSVLHQDKALALGLGLTLSGFFAYIPGKFVYNAVSSYTCTYWSQDFGRCLLQETPKHGNILNIISAVLVAIGVIFDIIVFYLTKDLNCYNSKYDESNCSITFSTIRTGTRYTELMSEFNNTPPNRPVENESNIQSSALLAELHSLHGTSSFTESQDNPSTVTYAQVLFPKCYKQNSGLELHSMTDENPSYVSPSEDVRRHIDDMRTFGSRKSDEKDQSKNMGNVRPQSPETDF